MSIFKKQNGGPVVIEHFNGLNADGVGNIAEPGTTFLFVDTETTGLDRENDCIIQIGYRKAFITDSGAFGYGPGFSAFNDPGRPIPPEITELTGIDDEMVRGESINWDLFDYYCQGADLLVAHNAAFDRAFIDRYSKASPAKIWACSKNDIDWNRRGFVTNKQEVLAWQHGFYYKAHTALDDVDALIFLLAMQDDETGKMYLEALPESALKSRWIVRAWGSNYHDKDFLKSNGFKWDETRRVWYVTTEDMTFYKQILSTIKCEPEFTLTKLADRFKEV